MAHFLSVTIARNQRLGVSRKRWNEIWGRQFFLIPVVSCSHAKGPGASGKDGKPVPSTHAGMDRSVPSPLRVRVDDPGLAPPSQLSHFRLFTKKHTSPARALGASYFAVRADVGSGTYRLRVCLCPGVLYVACSIVLGTSGDRWDTGHSLDTYCTVVDTQLLRKGPTSFDG